MANVLEHLQDFAGWIAGGKVALPDVMTIPAAQCDPGTAGVDIDIDRAYVTVDINELFLSNARVGWAVYNPLVVVSTSFIYGDKQISVPAVVGPNLLALSGQKSPQGSVIHDTTVAGPYPYRGGPMVISVVLYRVKQEDYLDSLFHVVEGLATAIGPCADMGVLSKVGRPLIDGLEKLCGMGQAEPIAGHRIELSSLKPNGFRTSFSALIDGAGGVPMSKLRVMGGRLKTTDGGGDPIPYDKADFVLYSVTATNRRQDLNLLPFYPLYESAIRDASQMRYDAWPAAKATFAELWQQLIVSPDLTREQARELRELWRNELREEHRAAQSSPLMANGEAPVVVDERLAEIASILEL